MSPDGRARPFSIHGRTDQPTLLETMNFSLSNRERKMPNGSASFMRYGGAVVSIALAIGVRLLLDPMLGDQFPFATLLFAVLLTAWFGGFGPALVAIGIGVIASTYFLLPPRGSFAPEGRDQWVGLLLYVFTSFGIAVLGGSMRAARRRAEWNAEAVRASEEKFRGLLEGASTPIVGVNSQGLIVLVNAATERLFGYTREELLNRPLETLVPERFGEAHRGHRARYATQPSTRPMGLCMDLFGRRKDGSEVPVEISLSPAETQEGLLVMAIIIDISRRKQAEEQLQRRAAELQAVNAELEAFTYSVSHDLRAPLRHIDGFSKLLMDGHSSELTEEARDYVATIRESTKEMSQLVDDLLNLARIGRRELSLQVTGLKTLVEGVVSNLKAGNTSRAIDWKFQPLPFVECDPSLMKQVFINLLSNAVKFTRQRDLAVIEVGSFQQDNQSVIFVRDNGVGFDMKYVGKLFAVFQRLHRQEDFEGTGIGLAIVHRVIQKHGGRVWAEGELNKGAVFYFTLGTPTETDSKNSAAGGTYAG